MASRADPRLDAIPDRDDVPAATPTPTAAEPTALAAYRPVALRVRADGWTAARQRTFLTVLAETGSISHACREAGVSSRSAYRLRQRPDAAAFATAWDQALRLATLRLTTMAFERATRGTVREIWRDGELVGHSRQPSDKLLMFLLSQLLPRRVPAAVPAGAAPGPAAESALDQFDRTIAELRTGFPATLAALADNPAAMVPLTAADFHPTPPGDDEEDT